MHSIFKSSNFVKNFQYKGTLVSHILVNIATNIFASRSNFRLWSKLHTRKPCRFGSTKFYRNVIWLISNSSNESSTTKSVPPPHFLTGSANLQSDPVVLTSVPAPLVLKCLTVLEQLYECAKPFLKKISLFPKSGFSDISTSVIVVQLRVYVTG